ncbi:hypothetical protein WOLCODRAFT_153248 [Wolfiporia cocos MD-104 SS10]|uniref:Uncharacterized protein n=1 Tax=Wolfiporia cocos (strain MD-104) TaxID=742152 RepID=A0A2H3K2B4_WOLCO|nr:hypothetical protein WOLCODRAFT_153248 [Wolfiporia cocos MD-104 SS10]
MHFALRGRTRQRVFDSPRSSLPTRGQHAADVFNPTPRAEQSAVVPCVSAVYAIVLDARERVPVTFLSSGSREFASKTRRVRFGITHSSGPQRTPGPELARSADVLRSEYFLVLALSASTPLAR